LNEHAAGIVRQKNTVAVRCSEVQTGNKYRKYLHILFTALLVMVKVTKHGRL